MNKGGTQPTSQFAYHEEKNFKTATVSAQQIEQLVERATQSITDQLVDHANQQVGCLEATVSKNTNLNDDGWHEKYHPIEVTQDVLHFLTSEWGFTPSPLNSAFLVGRRWLGSMRLVLIDGFLK